MDYKDNCKSKHQLFNIKLLIQNIVTDLITVVFSANVQTCVSKAINIEKRCYPPLNFMLYTIEE